MAAAIPFVYQVSSLIGLAWFARHRRLRPFGISLVMLMLTLPFLLQWSLGGFQNSGAVMIWAFSAPMAAMVLASPRAAPGAIQVSGATYRLLHDRYRFESRGPMEIRGIGRMETWLLLGPRQAALTPVTRHPTPARGAAQRTRPHQPPPAAGCRGRDPGSDLWLSGSHHGGLVTGEPP